MQISLTRALAEVKLINKKLDDMDFKLAKVCINDVLLDGGNFTPQSFLNFAKGVLASRADLRKRKRALKGAIAKANVETSVKIANENMSIIEAIAKKAELKIF